MSDPPQGDAPLDHGETRSGTRGAPARAPLPDFWWNLSLQSRRLVAAGVLVAVVLVLGLLVNALTGGSGPGRSEAEIFVAELTPEQLAVWDQLAECESESDWSLDTGNGYFGGLQFSMVSWQEVGGVGSPAQSPREEQIMRAEALLDLQGWQAWPRCSAQLGLG